ncbi:MAG: gamma-glutamyltransferase family protein [Chloroflexi bacterium]|nr:gamma-glutamyltransferase family protein [Chloroflexota bacterium]
MVSSGHYLAAAAGYRILEEGGNAIDAGVASGLALNVVLPHWTSIGGVAPTILHHAQKNETVVIDGLGVWPKAATIDFFKKKAGGQIPVGVLRCVTPAAADAWLTALRLYGTMPFEQVVTPALELAESGFPVPHSLHQALASGTTRGQPGATGDEGAMNNWPSSRDIFMPRGRVPAVGDVLVQKDLANSFRRLIEIERANASKGRETAIQAARDYFYKGEMAQEMVRFVQDEGGLLTMEDMAAYHVKLEPPTVGSFKGVGVYTCGPWCQGPVVLQALHILEALDLGAMGHNSADYTHVLLEALKLAFSDRHAYYGDPDFVKVPMAGLLSKAYAKERSRQIDLRRAWPEMPPAGDPWSYQEGKGARKAAAVPAPLSGGLEADTSYTCVVDRWGNAFSATPSDGFGGSPVVSGLGFIVSSRGSQSWLDPEHPSSLAPGKRPRLTPNPAMAFKDGKVWMPFGTPGGDMQCQAMVQMFLNMVEFGMDPQQAVEAPRVSAWSFPGSFWPHNYRPGLVGAEGRIAPSVVEELKRRGHTVEVWDDWSSRASDLCAIEIDRVRGILRGGADSRRAAYAIGR